MILNVLTEDLVEINIKAKSKKEILAKMLEIACKSGKVKDKRQAMRDVEEREALSSTGMQNGIAIPHGKTDAVDELIACVGITQKPIPFDSIDGKPANIFLMTLSPKDQGGQHIRFLSEIAKLLKDDKRRVNMLNAKSNKELLQIIRG